MASSEIIVDLKNIAGKTKTEVASILGRGTPADKEDQTIYGEKLYYKEGNFEIVYIDGLSDWITITGLKNIQFDPSSIRSLGFKDVHKPTFQNKLVIRWNLEPEIRQIQMSSGQDGKVWMIYIKVKTS